MIKSFIIILFCLGTYQCTNIKQAELTDNEENYNYKAQVNLYSKHDKEIIKKFYKFANHEYVARNNIAQICLEYISSKKLENVRCVYMGTKLTKKIITSLD
jgi:hypothetical protein